MEEIQMVDTPGLLDRPLYERNDIELQAILALNYLANLILFIIDASEFCGYTIDEQINLFKEIRELFEIEVIFIISADKGFGLEELKRDIKRFALKMYNAKEEESS